MQSFGGTIDRTTNSSTPSHPPLIRANSAQCLDTKTVCAPKDKKKSKAVKHNKRLLNKSQELSDDEENR